MNDIISNFEKTNIENSQSKLDIYYYLDFDKDVIQDHLQDHLQDHFEDYLQDIFKEYIKEFEIDQLIHVRSNNIKRQDDIIKTGVKVFDNMFNKLKLKRSNPVWFIYIGKGSLKTNTSVIQDIYIGLINKDPSVNQCFYAIHKENEKSDIIKSINVILKKLFLNKQKIISY
jgi:hypothetical protein